MILESYESVKSLFSNEKVSLDLDKPFERNYLHKSDSQNMVERVLNIRMYLKTRR